MCSCVSRPRRTVGSRLHSQLPALQLGLFVYSASGSPSAGLPLRAIREVPCNLIKMNEEGEWLPSRAGFCQDKISQECKQITVLTSGYEKHRRKAAHSPTLKLGSSKRALGQGRSLWVHGCACPALCCHLYRTFALRTGSSLPSKQLLIQT